MRHLYETSAKATGTNAGCTATIDYDAITLPAMPTTMVVALTVTGVQASGDAAATVTIESPSGTALWTQVFAGAFNLSQAFADGDIVTDGAHDVLLKVSASTSHSTANIQAAGIAAPAGTSLGAPALDGTDNI